MKGCQEKHTLDKEARLGERAGVPNAVDLCLCPWRRAAINTIWGSGHAFAPLPNDKDPS